MSLWEYEREQWKNGIQTICGVDEAGAGPLAGPVYAAAVILPREVEISGLNDSKKLSEKKRESLFDIITAQAISYSIARVEAAEIDEMLEKTFEGSLPAFIAAFTKHRRFSETDIDEIQKMIDRFRKGE